MKTSNALLLGGAGILGYMLYSRTKSAGTLKFFPYKVMSVDLQGTNIVFTIGIMAQNISNQDFVLKGLSADVYSNGFWVGNAYNFTGGVIARNSQVVIPVSFLMSPIGVVQDLIQAFQTGNFQQKIQIKGNANVSNSFVGLDLSMIVGI